MLSNELSPARPSVDSLRSRIGAISVLKEVTSYQKPDVLTKVFTHLVESGSGLVGIPAYLDDRLEWSGINRHIWASVAGTVGLGKRVKEKGFAVDLNLLASSMEPSHDGRRISDEAGWYKDDVANSAKILEKTNETIGLEILAEMGIEPDVYNLVSRLAHGVEHVPTKKHVLEFLIASYTDHRTTDKFQPFADRMAGFLLANFFKPGFDSETKTKVMNWMQQTVEKGRNRQLHLEDVVKEAESIGATPNSPRLALKDLMSIVVVESAFEQWLLDLGVDVDAVGNDIANPPRALTYAPRLYLNDVEQDGFAAIDSGKLESSKWGALELKRLHDKQHGAPYRGGRSPIKLVVTQDNQIKYKAPSGKLVDTIRTLKGQFARNSKDLLKLRETPEGHQRYFAAIPKVDFESQFNKQTGKLTQEKNRLTIHHPAYQDETVNGSFRSIVNSAVLRQERDGEMVIVSGTAPVSKFDQSLGMNEAFTVNMDHLQIDEVFADIKGKYRGNIEVVKATRAFTSNRSLTGWQRAIDFSQYLDDSTTWKQKARRFLSQTELNFTSFVKTLFNPKRRFISPTQ